MDTVKSGLGFYGYFKTYGMIFFGTLILLSAIFWLVQIIMGNYKKSPNSKYSYYTISDSTECDNIQINNNLCKIKLVYSDGTTIYKNDVNDPSQKAGNTIVFYKEKNPKSYMVTPNPYIYPGAFSCFACVIFTFAFIRLMIMNSSKDGAAFIGGLDLASDVIRRIK